MSVNPSLKAMGLEGAILCVPALSLAVIKETLEKESCAKA